MALDKVRLKGKIKTLLEALMLNEEDPAAAREQFATDLASAIVDEIKELKINYSGGLTAPNGAVGGVINHTVS